MFNVALGGGSNCWWAAPMRMHPLDFETNTVYGQGGDWPLSYGDIEEYYCLAEKLMDVSGDDDSVVLFRRSQRFPQPRHRFSSVSKLFKRRFEDTFFAMPQARARLATEFRNPCCSNSICSTCPALAKSTILNDWQYLLDNPKLEVLTQSKVTGLEYTGGVITSVSVELEDGQSTKFYGDTIVLGANGIFNPNLLLRSGISQGPVGLGLNEQLGLHVSADLHGLADGDGSSHVTGVGYSELHGEHRRYASGGFFSLNNLDTFRPDPKRWRERLSMRFLAEDLRQDKIYVAFDPSEPDIPIVHFEDYSSYVKSGVERFRQKLDWLLGHLPVEEHGVRISMAYNFAHIQGTTVMGRNPELSVVDSSLVHHKYRNLIVVGSSVFPTGPAVNPTLTLMALSLRAADKYFGGPAH